MIKIDIVSGFLGAGKTTFIKKLLKEYNKENIVIVENEFGEIGIDGEILQREGYKMIEISTGCICCLMQGDFILAMKKILEDTRPDRIIIEPTGISILSDIVKILKKEFTNNSIINSLITIVDCENYLEQCDVFGEFFDDQITYATKLIFSKTQNIDEETLNKIIKSVRQKNSDAKIVVKNWGDLTLDELSSYINDLDVLDYAKEMIEPNQRSCRDNKFSTYAKKINGVISKKYLEDSLNKLSNGEYGEVLRGKGFLKCEEGNYEFSYTNKAFRISHVDWDVSGKICFIGKNLNRENLDLIWKKKTIVKVNKMRCMK